MLFAACQSSSITSLLFYPVSSLFILSSFCLILFLDLWDLLWVGFGVRVMQPQDYSMEQIESDRLKLQYIGQKFRDIPIKQVKVKNTFFVL